MSVTEHRQRTVRFRRAWAREQLRWQLWIENNGWIDIDMVKTLSRPPSQQRNPNRLEPTRKSQLDLLERDEVKAKRPSMWNIVFYNDDYTSIDFGTQGKGIAGTYTFEVAEQKQCEVLLMAKIEEHPLRVESSRLDDSPGIRPDVI